MPLHRNAEDGRNSGQTGRRLQAADFDAPEGQVIREIQLCATAACIALAINVILAAVAFAHGYSQKHESDFVTVVL
ncbi:hypothetical protein PENSUB_2873 [Penicillium subrubescens]|jgi:hypothetical protein|uniref:Uncharacterized protein n=1 Tax=Penicillium subrubescens TaxID=1316194 RepID=A0A1Q5UGH5_9EURO|nr:hypothetical protein PENSUB_2873 [Penicillium subrubescens]